MPCGSYVDYAAVSGLRLTREDFAAHKGEWVQPYNTTYREDYMVTELPPNPQGIAALQMLNILEHYNLSAMGHNTADYLHAHIEAKKLAFADRAKVRPPQRTREHTRARARTHREF